MTTVEWLALWALIISAATLLTYLFFCIYVAMFQFPDTILLTSDSSNLCIGGLLAYSVT
jgi:hypothetical protein